jgi:hypothetical protein
MKLRKKREIEAMKTEFTERERNSAFLKRERAFFREVERIMKLLSKKSIKIDKFELSNNENDIVFNVNVSKLSYTMRMSDFGNYFRKVLYDYVEIYEMKQIEEIFNVVEKIFYEEFEKVKPEGFIYTEEKAYEGFLNDESLRQYF